MSAVCGFDYDPLVAVEESVEYYRSLQSSSRTRRYFLAHAPDHPTERWYFEAVEDNGELVAIRQLVIEGDGSRHSYSADHMEDEWGFLTDQPLDDSIDEGLVSVCTEDTFKAAWDGS